MLSEKKLTVDDLMIPETIGSNPDLAVKLREFNAARESFKSSCEAANDFATYKNEMGDSRSHIDTCNMDTINRINSEIELAKQLSMESHPETDAPNPFYDVFANAQERSSCVRLIRSIMNKKSIFGNAACFSQKETKKEVLNTSFKNAL
ncbi:hypothetical protein [Vibrio alginolyticus]|uniref:hypothetical protein n=1 Tax=Vibrio alginolyticus TaxID=663 RepID=UPI000A2927C9|nr:hypothetical protein [Vibrio alginolyticus]ARP11641.1 hypothetical protein K04M3_50720 [Vibrio alginolyticus]